MGLDHFLNVTGFAVSLEAVLQGWCWGAEGSAATGGASSPFWGVLVGILAALILVQCPAKYLGKQRRMVQGLGPLSLMWEIQMDGAPGPSFGLGKPTPGCLWSFGE